MAFEIYRDVICSVFPDTRVELDASLSLIGDLNLIYGRNVFYQFHNAFSGKRLCTFLNPTPWSNWSVLDTEIHIMLGGGS